MDNKDFFDEEYDKVSETQQDSEPSDSSPFDDENRQRQTEDWYSYGGGVKSSPQPPANQGGGKKALWISLVCVGLVLAIVFGWVLCAVFGGGQSQEEAILSEVLQYLRNEYYFDISDEDWQQAIADGGTAILQSAGDQYCRLMTPQEFYDYTYQVESDEGISTSLFGISYQFVNGLGLYVTQVYADTSCYGVLSEGDIIVKLSDVKYSLFAGGSDTEFDLSTCDAEEFAELFKSSIRSAKFHVLRNGEIEITDEVVRGGAGIGGINPAYDFDFIEFYFDDAYRNISITPQNNAKVSTKDYRRLDQLPADTGYIRISSFMYYVADEETEVTAAHEFQKVMTLFNKLGLKRLVLDLKGNPGGRVDAATQIASMLVTDAKLTSEQKETVYGRKDKNGNQTLLLTTLVHKNGSFSETSYLASSYTKYFAAPTSANALCDIVVWTDGGSASASELLTGALLDYKTGFQIGATTYGKGIAQSIKQLPFKGEITTVDGKKDKFYWGIYYTSAKYYSPLGNNIHRDGYTPTDGYAGIYDYSDLWTKTKQYWNIAD
ncbi:MAG: S41 family peptidase [Corallococcus sp.]|nr:S41 family peptidase [Corallococcus sp.]MCM1359310.1 S41 family peptidase [Corallococcus sp.]MCM1394879.1 S41 family peptidase [Corallococcus sp.]